MKFEIEVFKLRSEEPKPYKPKGYKVKPPKYFKKKIREIKRSL